MFCVTLYFDCGSLVEESFFMNCLQLIMDKRDRVEKEKVLAQYVVDSLNTHNFWAFKVFRDSAM